MTDTPNTRTLRRLMDEVWSKGNLSIIPEIIADEFTRHGPVVEGRTVEGRDGFTGLVNSYRTGFPDLIVLIDGEVIEHGDLVVTRWRVRGTNTGEAFGQPPTGRPLEISGVNVLRFDRSARVVEEWLGYDTLGIIQQTGLGVPPM